MRVLIEFHSSLGDFITELPILHALRASGRMRWVELVVRTPCDALLEGYDWVDGIHVRNRGLKGRYGPAVSSWHQPFDLRFYLRQRHGIDPGAVFVRANKTLGVESFDPSVGGEGVLVHRFSILKSILGQEMPDVPRARIPVREERRQEALRRSGLAGSARILCVSPGAGRPRKQWAPERFADLISAIGADFDGVAVLGSPSESGLCDEVAARSGAKSLQIGLAETAALLAEADLHIGNDSALGHLAASQGCATVSIGPACEYFTPWKGYAVGGNPQAITVADVIRVLTENDLIARDTSR